MGLTKVVGAIFLVLSTMVFIVVTFLYWNSSAYLDYNAGISMNFIEKLVMNGLFIPYSLCIIFFSIGFMLAKDKVMADH